MGTDGSIRSTMDAHPAALAAENGGGTGGGVGLLLLLFVILVICGAYFGGAESGFSAMNKIRIKAKAEDGDKRAKNAMLISSDFDRALTTLLIGNNLTHIAAASVAAVIAARLFGTSDEVTLYCTVITTLVVFLFSEMIPKSFANDRSETTALRCAGSLRFFMRLFYPLVVFFSAISLGVTRLVSRFVKKNEEPTITEEELYDIIDTIEEEGVMNEEQGDLFKSALDFSDTRAKDVMTMRGDICALRTDMTNAEIAETLRKSTYTRLPVYEGDLDHIAGILQMRVFLREYLRDPDVDMRALLMPAFHVDPQSNIDDLLTQMRQHKFYLSIVSDAEGKTLGLVTIEDFLEELVGEIWDEDDVVDKDFVKLGGNRVRVSTHLTFGETTKRLGLTPPETHLADRPLLSFILERFGRLPEEGDSFVFRNMEITVDAVDNGHIDTAVLRLLTDEDLAELSAGNNARPGEGAEA